MRIVLDSGGVSWLAQQSSRAAAVIEEMRTAGLWPVLMPAPVVVECLTGQSGWDVPANRLLKSCDVVTDLRRPWLGGVRGFGSRRSEAPQSMPS